MKIELCAGSLEAILLTKNYQFDSIELCQNLESGGLTPSYGLQKFAFEKSECEVHVLIRPRIGDFFYTAIEKKCMIYDIHEALELGCDGIVIGSLTENSELDIDFLKQLKTTFPETSFTFHRAFDEINNKEKALNQLIDFGFTRILTSGSKKNILNNLIELKEIKNWANGKIEIICGGGINSKNVQQIVQLAQPDAIHFSGTEYQNTKNETLFSVNRLTPSKNKIEDILNQIDNK